MIKIKQNKIYTGVGSRKTPDDICNLMTNIATYLRKEGYILRSGGSDGADNAFELLIFDNSEKEIYLPWRKFNGNNSKYFNVTKDAFKIASRHHQWWYRLKYPTKLLLGRNIYQVLGESLEKPSDFVICWTTDGKNTGGTGLTIRIAKSYNIPVYNLFNQNIKKNIFNILRKNHIQK